MTDFSFSYRTNARPDGYFETSSSIQSCKCGGVIQRRSASVVCIIVRSRTATFNCLCGKSSYRFNHPSRFRCRIERITSVANKSAIASPTVSLIMLMNARIWFAANRSSTVRLNHFPSNKSSYISETYFGSSSTILILLFNSLLNMTYTNSHIIRSSLYGFIPFHVHSLQNRPQCHNQVLYDVNA